MGSSTYGVVRVVNAHDIEATRRHTHVQLAVAMVVAWQELSAFSVAALQWHAT